MTFCPFCGTRQDIDLRQINFRDLGNQGSLPCPGCENLLDVIEFETEPPVQIERCKACLGMFFNPGELEFLLEQKTNPLVWLDNQKLEEISANYGYNHEVVYRKCPMCEERMSHINFGGRSGVILDRCGTHGVWLEGGELRRLLEWWRAGGKHLHQANEQEKISQMREMKKSNGPIESTYSGGDWSPVETAGDPSAWVLLADALFSIADIFD